MTAARRLAANLFFLLHCAFSLFVVFGAFLAIINRGWMWVHVPAVLWTFAVDVADWDCPLTIWEERFRNRASHGFINRYLGPLLGSDGEPRRLEIAVGFSLLIWNLLLYVVICGALATRTADPTNGTTRSYPGGASIGSVAAVPHWVTP